MINRKDIFSFQREQDYIKIDLMARTFHRDPPHVSMLFSEVSASATVICIRHFDKLFARAPV